MIYLLELKGDTETVNFQLMARSDKGLKSMIDRPMTIDKVLFRSCDRCTLP